MCNLKILSWNVNGVSTKLEKNIVTNLLYQYDVIGLNEVKTNSRISFPGYVSYGSGTGGGGRRGGTVVLVRRALHSAVMAVDTSVDDQVWLRLSCLQGVLLGFVYVPPHDSPYFSPTQFGAVQERIKAAKPGTKFVIMGDMNTRFGESVRSLPCSLGVPQAHLYTYPHIPDPVRYANDNARTLASLCSNEMLIVINNLKTHKQYFPSKLTFKKTNEWKSELDVCIASTCMVQYLSEFNVWQDMSLPSDHAPISVSVSPPGVDVKDLCVRAQNLGDHATLHTRSNNALVKRPTKSCNINVEEFHRVLAQRDVPVWNTDGHVDRYAEEVADTLYECSRISYNDNRSTGVDATANRWDKLLRDNDDKRVWQSIDWKGEYRETIDNSRCPDDEEFKLFFEELLKPSDVTELDIGAFTTPVSIPILDSEISAVEVEHSINKLKGDKASGPDGLCPGIFKVLPMQWLLSLTILFNTIFISGCYPSSWRLARLLTIFKRGDPLLPSNYRGINVINSIAKIYDLILCNRLMQWFSPYREQAGGQPKRGCMEHITTLRILLDIARRKKFPLFVTFVDFSQAYDRVPRDALMGVLRRLGCGAVMLAALVAMYSVTHSVLGTAVLTATVGVRQGSPTSCILFVLFINDLVKLLKENCGRDGFLVWLHTLVLMDDTVLLATSRNSMQYKLSLLRQYCRDYGMRINVKKTKFFAVNVRDEKRDFSCGRRGSGMV